MKAYEIFDTALLDRHVSEGIIRAAHRDDMGLTAYKYSQRAVVTRTWDDVTLKTRGLVLSDDGSIVARPFDKFFNLSEHPEGSIDLDAPGLIMDKADGSLGIVFPFQGRWFVSTSGSLTSDQSVHATALMNERYSHIKPVDGLTLLVEIIYPDNRIVSDYGEMDDLVLLGAMSRAGRWFSPVEAADLFNWTGPVVDHRVGTIREALETPDPDDTTEGFVIRTPQTMVKIKYPSYLILHRAVSNLSHKTVLEALENGSFQEFLAILPDEFHEEAKGIAAAITVRKDEIVGTVQQALAGVPEGDRKTKAIWITQNVPSDLKSLVMNSVMYDAFDLDAAVLKTLRKNFKES